MLSGDAAQLASEVEPVDACCCSRILSPLPGVGVAFTASRAR